MARMTKLRRMLQAREGWPMRDSAGFSLFEMVIVLMIVGLVLGGIFQLIGSISQQVTDQAAARQLLEVQRAAQDYVTGNYDEALYYASCATVTSPRPANAASCPRVPNNTVRQMNIGTTAAPTATTASSSIDLLRTRGYLAQNFDGINPFFQHYMIFTRYAGGEQLEVYVAAVDLSVPADPVIPDIRGGRIASMVGADGGFVIEEDALNPTTNIVGAYGGWSQAANALSANGITVGEGNVVAMNHFNGGSLISSYLHRYPVPGFLQANRMFTALTFDAPSTTALGANAETQQVAATTPYDNLTERTTNAEFSPPILPALRTRCRNDELFAFSLCDVGNVRFVDDASAAASRRGVDGHDLDLNWNRVLNVDTSQGALFTAMDFNTLNSTSGTTLGNKLSTWQVNDDTRVGFWAVNAPVVALGSSAGTVRAPNIASRYGDVVPGRTHTTTLVVEDYAGVLGTNLFNVPSVGPTGFYVEDGGLVAAGERGNGGILAGNCTPLVNNRIIACNGLLAQNGDVVAANGGVMAGTCAGQPLPSGRIVACNGLTVNAGGMTVNGDAQFNNNVRIAGTLNVTGDSTFSNVTITGNLNIGECNNIISSVGAINACDYVTARNDVRAGGSMWAQAFYYDSDARLKHHVTPVNDALSRLMAIKGVSWDWNRDDKTSMGVIAQDVEKVFPELVSESPNGTKAVAYNGFVAPIIEGMRDLQQQNEALRAEVERLKEDRGAE